MLEFENQHPEKEVFLGQEGRKPLPLGAPHAAPGLSDSAKVQVLSTQQEIQNDQSNCNPND